MAVCAAILLCTGTLGAISFCLILIEFIEELVGAAFGWQEFVGTIHLLLSEAYTFSIHS